MSHYLTLSIVFLSLLQSYSCQIARRQEYRIEWDSSNEFFQSNTPVLNVRLGDSIDFLCPSAKNQSSTAEYNAIYLVSAIDYNLCFTEHYQPLVRCDQPFNPNRLIYTLSISKYLPYPNTPEFLDGRSYYFISTSTGAKAGINQTYDGLCRTKNLRLIVDVHKFYRRYSKNDNMYYRSRVQSRLSNHTNEESIISSSSRISFSTVFLVLCSFLYLYL